MHLRKATEDDRDFVYQLCRAGLQDYFESVEEGWSDEKFQDNYNPENIRIIESEGATVGYFEYKEEGEVLKWQNLHITPDFQRQGFGSAIVERLKTIALEIEGKVFRQNQASRAFLKSNGFSEIEFLPEEDSYRVRWKRNS